MKTGFICVPRGWMAMFNLPSAKQEPFDHRSAWLWLLENAAFQPHTVTFGGRKVALERGQLIVSNQYLAGAWGWNTTKVRRALQASYRASQLVGLPVPGGTLLTVCQYDEIFGHEEAPVLADEVTRPTPRRSPVLGLEEGNKGEDKAVEQGEPGNVLPFPRGENESSPESRPKSAKPKPPKAAPAGAVDDDFEEFWKAYPPNLGPKKKAREKYATALRSGADAGMLLVAAKRFADHRRAEIDAGESTERFTPHAATWLAQERWTIQLKPYRSRDEAAEDKWREDIYRGML